MSDEAGVPEEPGVAWVSDGAGGLVPVLIYYVEEESVFSGDAKSAEAQAWLERAARDIVRKGRTDAWHPRWRRWGQRG